MIVEFTFDWGVRLTEDQAERLRPVLQGTSNAPLLVGPPPTDKPHSEWWGMLHADITDVLRALPELADKIRLSKTDLPAMLWDHVVRQLNTLVDRQSSLSLRHNNLVNVAIPGVGVLLIDNVTVLEDCCTDRLQQYLDAGWRILAVCPQEARRPDYVLGRTGPEPATRHGL